MCSAKRWSTDVDGIVKRGAGSARHAPPRILLIGGSGPLAPDGTPDEIGFKAYNLMRMARIGLRVPPAFV